MSAPRGDQEPIFVGPDPEFVADLIRRLSPCKEQLVGKLSVHHRQREGCAACWIYRWRHLEPGRGRTVQSSGRLPGEREARGLQLVVSCWRDERQRRQQAQAAARREAKEIRETVLGAVPLGPRAMRRGRRVFKAAEQRGMGGLYDFVFRRPQRYLGIPGRPRATARLVRDLPQQPPPPLRLWRTKKRFWYRFSL